MTARPSPLRAVLAILLWAAALPVAAYEIRAQQTLVVELFTSQACSRCPEADLLLTGLAERPGTVALAYHIDYWDYTGWQDTFARPDHTRLQRAYAQSWGKTRIFTPQMVVNGQTGVVGSDAGQIEAAIAGTHLPLQLAVAAQGPDAVSLSLAPDPRHGEAIIWLVTYRDTARIVIERGENSGRVLDYSHIVTGRQAVGVWRPATGAEITVPVAEILGNQAHGVAVLVQEKNGALPGPILGAALILR